MRAAHGPAGLPSSVLHVLGIQARYIGSRRRYSCDASYRRRLTPDRCARVTARPAPGGVVGPLIGSPPHPRLPPAHAPFRSRHGCYVSAFSQTGVLSPALVTMLKDLLRGPPPSACPKAGAPVSQGQPLYAATPLPALPEGRGLPPSAFPPVSLGPGPGHLAAAAGLASPAGVADVGGSRFLQANASNPYLDAALAAPTRTKFECQGRVQGVHYRTAMQRQARQLGVTGWVRNTQDGTVEGAFECPAAQTIDMLRWINQGPSGAMVTSCKTNSIQQLPTTDTFTIKADRPKWHLHGLQHEKYDIWPYGAN